MRLGERLGKGDGVGIEGDCRAGREVGDFGGGDLGPAGVEAGFEVFRVARRIGHQDKQSAAGLRPDDGGKFPAERDLKSQRPGGVAGRAGGGETRK